VGQLVETAVRQLVETTVRQLIKPDPRRGRAIAIAIDGG